MPRIVPLALVALAFAAAPAAAREYPPPGNPGHVTKPPKNGRTLRVCKHGAHRYRTIQQGVDAARSGDTVKVCPGVYHEGVLIQNTKRRRHGRVVHHYRDYLRLIGVPKHPRRVVIDSKGVKGIDAQNGVEILGANHVTVRGFWARHYKGNGFFALSVTGYDLSHLVASLGGAYGIYAFKSRGGTMSHDEGYYNNDAGFYIGATPPQAKPVRSIVSHNRAWGNVIGFSGTNVRYTTITKSDFYNNGIGITSNSATSEPYTGPAHNDIVGNRIFWNNFDYREGAPFSLKGTSIGGSSSSSIPYPQGLGTLLFGGRHNTYASNQVFGNWLGGISLVPQVLLAADTKAKAKDRAQAALIGNTVRGNAMGRRGTDLNGRDLAYDGSGRGNCFSANTGVQVTESPDPAVFAACPFAGANHFDAAAQGRVLSFSLDPETNWIRHPHAPVKGVEPLERCTVTKTGCRGFPKG
jgi:hypothetical protein